MVNTVQDFLIVRPPHVGVVDDNIPELFPVRSENAGHGITLRLCGFGNAVEAYRILLKRAEAGSDIAEVNFGYFRFRHCR